MMCGSKRRHHVLVLDRARRGDVNHAVDLAVVAHEPQRAEEIVDVDPADPLIAFADPSTQPEFGEPGESFVSRGVVEVARQPAAERPCAARDHHPHNDTPTAAIRGELPRVQVTPTSRMR